MKFGEVRELVNKTLITRKQTASLRFYNQRVSEYKKLVAIFNGYIIINQVSTHKKMK